ncbi:hypothetical protein MWN34_10650 [Ancylobacter sp. 6x-1]|uniref:Uncharacterized protein n=1 Tax=Ancylobacter crimeensis TaxID=2579147 RepID=A0ABT0DBM5_9HYPH|nr:hypothetical protein [Ancylobacter crimeensis]MCK0197371.1 hypothetical protein [Ancylobacter crimeensis]
MASKSKRAARITKAVEAEKARSIKDALNELKYIDAISLDDTRLNCAQGLTPKLKAMQEARSNGFPEVWEYCAAAVDAAAERKLSAALYGSLTVREMGIGNQVDSEGTMEAVANGEDLQTMLAIRRAAAKGDSSYTGITGKVMPLRPELAYDLGHYQGQAKPESIPAISAGAQAQGVVACYAETPLDSITLDGHVLPATKACFIVGGNAGKRYAVSPEQTGSTTPPNPAPEDTGALTPAPTPGTAIANRDADVLRSPPTR